MKITIAGFEVSEIAECGVDEHGHGYIVSNKGIRKEISVNTMATVMDLLDRERAWRAMPQRLKDFMEQAGVIRPACPGYAIGGPELPLDLTDLENDYTK